MLTFHKGAAGGPQSARAMAEYYGENTIPEHATALADYYLRGVARSEADCTAAIPRQDVAPHVAAALGLDINRTATAAEVTNLMLGLRADGAEIAGRSKVPAQKRNERIVWADFTFSAPKSVSIAMALAPTDAERHMIAGAHRDAWMAGMAHLETIIAHARKGAGGSKGSIPGKLGWVSYDHYTARPSIHIPHTEADGTKTTLIQTVHNRKIPADMQLHTHVVTPTAVFCDDGTVGSVDSLAMHDRVHEVGAYYQAHLATNLRAMGIDVVLDERTETARLAAVPQAISDLFSKRSHDGEAEARKMVTEMGRDWDSMHSLELAGLVKWGTRTARRTKDISEIEGDLAAWRAQAQAAGYEHRSVVDPEAKGRLPPSEQDRLTRGYLAALPVLERQFTRRATMYGSVARVAAARGLIAFGVESAEDIDRITAAMREHGVRHDGQQVALQWAKVATEGEGASVGGRIARVKIITTRHVAMEREAMDLAAAAAADRSGALTTGQIDRAVRDVTARDGLDFTSEHGLEQRRVLETIGTAGRFAVAVGVAGAGKSTLLRPLVDAWTAPTEQQGDERAVYGTALSTRQAEALADAGIRPANTMPIAALLDRANNGAIALNERSVVVVDEMSQIGTAQALGLLRLRATHGFTIAAIGDDRQNQAIEAGSTIKLMRSALGAEAVPELESSVRQLRERDRATALLFRHGEAEAGIARLQEDGHAILVPGGHRQAIEATADLWAARTAANANRAGYTLTVSAPTNNDARAIGAAIRERRRSTGAVGPDQVVIQATDQNRVEYELPLAVGDRVRLFARTPASFGGKGGNLGNNGSVVEVERIDAKGLQLRNQNGRSGFVLWSTMQDTATGRVKLTYGDVLSIDAIQGNTSTEHIDAMPSGSQAVNSYKSYVAKSRARETTWMVVSDGCERSEIIDRRAIGNNDPIVAADMWENVARNLSRQPEKELATDLLKRAGAMHTGTVRSLATAFQPIQQREADGPGGATFHRAYATARDTKATGSAAPAMARAAAASAQGAAEAVRRIAGPSKAQARLDVQAARRSMRPASQRPKRQHEPTRPPMSQSEALAEFTEALHRAGLRPRGPIRMDGQRHYSEVEGSRSKRGFYVAHPDGIPAGTIINHKTGERIDWTASRAPAAASPEDRARQSAQVAADRTARLAERQRGESQAARKAEAALRQSKPATSSHPYLARKGVQAHGLRQDRRGNLLVPMRDLNGKVWGVQTIAPDGGKLFAKGGRKQGTFALLGRPGADSPLVFAEGVATAASVREATSLAMIVVFDAGNLHNVVKAFHEREPGRRIVIMADNDHHLPRKPVPQPNVGVEKAKVAAEATGGVVLLPPFASTDAGTDWNDFVAQHGKAAAQAVIREALESQGIALPSISQTQRDATRQQSRSRSHGAEQDRVRTAQEAARRAQERGPSNGPHL